MVKKGKKREQGREKRTDRHTFTADTSPRMFETHKSLNDNNILTTSLAEAAMA